MAGNLKARNAKRGWTSTLPRVLIVIGLVIGLSVLIDFNRRIQTERRLVSQASQLSAEVTLLAATQSALSTELAYASSDGYVAWWAHSEGRYVQPGEILVVPMAPNGPTSTPAPALVSAPRAESNFKIWMSLFFGSGS